MLRCKRRPQLTRDRTPVRPHVLHSLPHGYDEGDLNAIANGGYPPTGDALGTAEQASGQHQGRCLVDTEPVMLHELDPTDHRTVGRVDLVYFHPLAADLHVGRSRARRKPDPTPLLQDAPAHTRSAVTTAKKNRSRNVHTASRIVQVGETGARPRRIPSFSTRVVLSASVSIRDYVAVRHATHFRVFIQL